MLDRVPTAAASDASDAPVCVRRAHHDPFAPLLSCILRAVARSAQPTDQLPAPTNQRLMSWHTLRCAHPPRPLCQRRSSPRIGKVTSCVQLLQPHHERRGAGNMSGANDPLRRPSRWHHESSCRSRGLPGADTSADRRVTQTLGPIDGDQVTFTVDASVMTHITRIQWVPSASQKMPDCRRSSKCLSGSGRSFPQNGALISRSVAG
jgi:hypothetical protein